MPELPDVVVYRERLAHKIVGQPLAGVRLRSAFLLRTATPPLQEAFGRTVVDVRRLGKRLVIALEGELFLVVHLMIAGRLRWKRRGTAVPARNGLAAFDFDTGSLVFTEASKKKRASLHVVAGEQALAAFDRGGLYPIGATYEAVAERLRAENHTLKRGLTDPRAFDGIGGAYADEIMFRARLSPVKWTSRLTDEEVERLRVAMHDVMVEWIDRFREAVGDGFPDKVTAFQPEMAVHGKYREPCPVCGAPVQRIVYATRETNYCAACQNDGRILKDRALSQLLKKDWPRTLEELENLGKT